MNSRQRVQAIFSGKRVDRPAFNFWMDRPALHTYNQLYACGKDFRIQHYGADVLESLVQIPFFTTIDRKVKNEGASEWQYASAVDEIETVLECSMPNPTDTQLYEALCTLRTTYPDKAIFAMILSQLDVLLSIRTMEDLFCDFYDKPKVVQTLCERINAINVQVITCIATHCDVDAIYLAGDICGNTGSLLSPHFLETYWLPGIQMCVETAHRYNLPVLYHTDGRIMEILDLLNRSGVDGINPLQANVQNWQEFSPWKQRFIVYGALDNNVIIPQGPIERIRTHIQEIFSHLHDGRGLIFSSHDIQEDTPISHIDAMVDQIKLCQYPLGK